MNKKIIIFIVFLLLYTQVPIVNANKSAKYPAPKKVLLLSSYHPTFPTSSKIVAGINSVFKNEFIELNIEYMDSKRLNDATHLNNFYSQLAYKLSK